MFWLPDMVGEECDAAVQALVKHYTRQSLGQVLGPITIVAGKRRRLSFVECPQVSTQMQTCRIWFGAPHHVLSGPNDWRLILLPHSSCLLPARCWRCLVPWLSNEVSNLTGLAAHITAVPPQPLSTQRDHCSVIPII